jgi:predicted amino acid-binding ACT domain protein
MKLFVLQLFVINDRSFGGRDEKQVITVIGFDKTGLFTRCQKILFELGINIEDISQTVMQKYFTMLMFS